MTTALHSIVADQLWDVPHVIRMMPGVHLPARMVVLRLPDGLALHSPVPLDDALTAAIRSLGPVRYIIAPNNYHHLYLRPAMERFPDAEVWAAPGLAHKRKGLNLSGLFGSDAAPPFSSEFAPIFLAGAPKMDETVFLHRPTRTLVVTDSLFNLMDGAPGLLSPLLFRLFGSWKTTAQSRIWRSIVKDRAAMAASTRAVLAADFDRLIMAHGVILETDGKAAYEQAARWLFK